MPVVDKDQLEALRDRVEADYRRVEDDYRQAEENYRHAEENYRLDIAAIEHLQRRFSSAPASMSSSSISPTGNSATSIPASDYSSSNGLISKPPATIQQIQPPQSTSASRVNEEWEIFKSIHK